MRNPLPVVVAVILIAALVIAYMFITGDADQETVSIESIFVDGDKDGDDDLVIYAKVVLKGSTTFLLHEPEIEDTIDDMVDNELVDGEVVAVFTLFSEVDEPLMSSGEPYAEWQDRAAGCPEEYPYWTTITLPGGEVFTCLHRNGIPYYKGLNDGEVYIQLLIDSLPVPLETRVTVKVAINE